MSTYCVHRVALDDECNVCRASGRAYHDTNHWLSDRRPILAAMMVDGTPEPAVYTDRNGCGFERFERPGDMASIPWLRVRYRETEVEAPLSRWVVSYAKDPVL
jgi:hypothetical protein